MKILISSVILIYILFQNIQAQKLKEPKLLGNWITEKQAGEFWDKKILVQTKKLLKDNPKGKLIFRICGGFHIYGGIIRAPLNPFEKEFYSQDLEENLSDKIFVALSPICWFGSNVKTGVIKSHQVVYPSNQIWFVPDKINFEVKELYPIKNIVYKSHKTIEGLVNHLKNNKKSNGFVTYQTKNKKVLEIVKKAEKNLEKFTQAGRVLIQPKPFYLIDEKGFIREAEDETQKIPKLMSIEIKKVKEKNYDQ